MWVERAVDMLAPAFSGSERERERDPAVGWVKRGNGWRLITCWDVVWIEAALVTVRLSSWWGNYSLRPGSCSLYLHLEVFTCSPWPVQFVWIMQWKKFPLIRREVGLFCSLLPAGIFFFILTSNSHTGEIFWLRSIITARIKGSHRAALLTATVIMFHHLRCVSRAELWGYFVEG